MTDLIISAPSPIVAETQIESGPFWPPIDPAKIRAEYRIDNTVTPDRLRAALYESIAETNYALLAWRQANQDLGITTLASVLSDQIDGESIKIHKYRRAVGSLTKAMLLERSRDIDTSAKEDKAADALDPQIEDHRRDWHGAIADIIGRPRATVELI